MKIILRSGFFKNDERNTNHDLCNYLFKHLTFNMSNGVMMND